MFKVNQRLSLLIEFLYATFWMIYCQSIWHI